MGQKENSAFHSIHGMQERQITLFITAHKFMNKN